MPKIELEGFEALTLIEFLLRFRDEEKLAIEHEAEEQILYDLCAMLESEVPELFDPKYKELVAKAREKIVKGDHY
ncbi:MAG: hypothetical protein OEZ58_18985 [Gammaproteobacteria bacterium]|nr:hypothetical protein [Gammaproteobacteria bacterium]